MKNFAVDLVILLIVLGIAGGLWYMAREKTPVTPRAVVSYVCAEGNTIAASYYEGEKAPPPAPGEPPHPTGSVALSLSDGRAMTLPQTLSASGIRYANADESFIFWSKGKTTFVVENGTQTYKDCVQQ